MQKTMARNHNVNRGRRKPRINDERVMGWQEHEIRYLADRLDCSEEDIRGAIEAVGDGREKVERYIRGIR
jgi:hypothetical protein